MITNISLIINKNLNILLNTKTGKWIGFIYNSNISDQEFTNISFAQISQIFANYPNLATVEKDFKIISEKAADKNNLLKKMNYLILHVSDLCNMNCAYCYAESPNTKPNLMSAETMVEAINKVFIEKEDLYVLFHGREPLTNYNNILQVLDKYKLNNKIHFILQTNGMLLTENKIEKLLKYNVNISISFDGLDDDANSFRINNTQNEYTKKITELLSKHKELSTILIVHENNYKKIIEISKKLIELGHFGSSYNFLWPTHLNPQLSNKTVDSDKLVSIMQELFDFSVNEDHSKFIFKERELYLLYGKVVYRHINNYMCNRVPCGAGTNCLSVNSDGDVYACTVVNNQPENYMGNIFRNDLDVIMSSSFKLKDRDLAKIPACSKCPLAIFCGGGGCSGFIYNINGNVNELSIYCNYYKSMILFIMKRAVEYSNNGYFINS